MTGNRDACPLIRPLCLLPVSHISEQVIPAVDLDWGPRVIPNWLGSQKSGRFGPLRPGHTTPRVTPVRMLLSYLLQWGGQGKVLTPVPQKDL
jgi:hypothetical protein